MQDPAVFAGMVVGGGRAQGHEKCVRKAHANGTESPVSRPDNASEAL